MTFPDLGIEAWEKAKKKTDRKMKKVKTTTMSVSEISGMGSMCCWDGCTKTFEKDMPPGWNWLVAFWAPGTIHGFAEIGPKDWLADCALCPEHSQALVANFKIR